VGHGDASVGAEVEMAALKGASSQGSGRAEMEVPGVAGDRGKGPVRATAGRRRNSVRSVPPLLSGSTWACGPAAPGLRGHFIILGWTFNVGRNMPLFFIHQNDFFHLGICLF
jgi:hypothetical protein